MLIAPTPRLSLRPVTFYDADFLLNLMNQPSYHRYIGDRGIRDVPGALYYIQTQFIESYEKHGFGLYAAVVHGETTPAGICGLVKREHLAWPDLGFAFLPEYGSMGLAREAALAVLLYARDTLQLPKLLAVTSQDNEASIRLLEKIGFAFQETIQFPGDPETLKLFSCPLAQRVDHGAGQV